MQQRSGELDLLIALDVFGTDVEQRHLRASDTQGLRRHRPHHRELEQVLGTAIDVGAQVEQLAITTLGRNRRDHGRTINTRQRLEHIT
ncbi:hypothetical protein D3C71_1944460 [compost metagenome]